MKKCITYLFCMLPLGIAGAISLGWDFMGGTDWQIRLTIGAVFGLLAFMIILSKLFFDFLTVMFVSRLSDMRIESGKVFDLLIKALLTEGILAFAAIVICNYYFSNFSVAIMLAFAFINTVYYYIIGKKIEILTSKRAVMICFAAYSLICWGFSIYRVLSIFY